ncbi:MAG: geranylgeranylglycerol-phosphate geranylgeranyltransferase [Desulfurococcaceae archaeon]
MGFKHYLSTMRPFNSLMSGVGVIFTALLCSKYTVTGIDNVLLLLLGFYTGFAVTGASMAINDIVDEEVDRINKPWKPLPMGYVNRKFLITTSIAMVVLALLLNALVDIKLLAITLVYTVIGISYSMLRKYWWSQLLVALSTTGPIIYGYVLFTAKDVLALVAMFSTTIFLVTLAREILKAIQDLEGDKLCGYKTIPIKIGVRKAKHLMIIVAVMGVAMGIITGVIATTNILYMVLIVISGSFYLHNMIRAHRNTSREILETTRRNTLISMMMGLVAFWLSRV